jgi:hypothetical protein
MNRVFLNEIEPLDQTYRFIRDNPDGAEEKAFVEYLWAFFSPYADRSFRSDIARCFPTKFWEMYLAFGLAMQGAKLQRILSGGQGRGSRLGPDLLLSGLPHPVWVEATVPFRGTGPDQVPEMPLEADQSIPTEGLILRYCEAIDKKFRKLLGYFEKGVVKDSESYVIAINSRSLPFGIYEPPNPRILQALFPVGDFFVTIDRRTKRVVRRGHHYRPRIEKRSGKPVSTDIFLDPTYAGISAVLFCPANVWHRPPTDAEIGLDFMLIHNPMAKNKIPHQGLKCGRECWVEDDRLVIKNWYKEHPSYVKETEPVLTLEDAIQQAKAQRRVTRGMLDRWQKDGA